jgi:dihydroflavonol-4-reductase
MRAFVTGAAGFIGSAIPRALLDDGHEVVAFLDPGADAHNLDGLGVARRDGDLRDATAVRGAVDGCDVVFHVAALYRFWAPDPRTFYEVNVGGTRAVLAAARDAGVDKVVYTSTVGTLGLDRAGAGAGANELDYPDVGHLVGAYKRSKYVAEHEVLRAAAEGMPVSLILPTMPIGPRDRAPTPSGRLVLDFLNGRMPGYVDTVLNVVHVDDVARAHLLAWQKGAQGRSYIAGGENLTMQQILATLASLTGLPAPTLHVPRSLTLAAAWVSDTIEGRLLRRTPRVPLEAARMSTTTMAFDDSRARTELAYSPRPVAEALRDSAEWYLANGYVHPSRQRAITLS